LTRSEPPTTVTVTTYRLRKLLKQRILERKIKYKWKRERRIK